MESQLSRLIALALSGSTGMTLLILACTLDKPNWWPAIVAIFYIICPFPSLIAKRLFTDNSFSSQSSPPKEWAYFITTGIVISALALPVVMARTQTVSTN